MMSGKHGCIYDLNFELRDEPYLRKRKWHEVSGDSKMICAYPGKTNIPWQKIIANIHIPYAPTVQDEFGHVRMIKTFLSETRFTGLLAPKDHGYQVNGFSLYNLAESLVYSLKKDGGKEFWANREERCHNIFHVFIWLFAAISYGKRGILDDITKQLTKIEP